MDVGVGLPTNLRGTSKDLVLHWARTAESAGFASLCMGERLTWNAQPDGVAPAGDRVGHLRGARHDHRERAGPERVGEGAGRARHRRRPFVELRCVREVHDHRMVGGAPLHREQAVDCVGVGRVGTEPVHGLGRKRHQPAAPKDLDRARDLVVDVIHGAQILPLLHVLASLFPAPGTGKLTPKRCCDYQ